MLDSGGGESGGGRRLWEKELGVAPMAGSGVGVDSGRGKLERGSGRCDGGAGRGWGGARGRNRRGCGRGWPMRPYGGSSWRRMKRGENEVGVMEAGEDGGRR